MTSQIYGGGGNTGTTFQNDHVELFNRGTSPVDLSDFLVQYASATGTFNSVLQQPADQRRQR